MKLVNNRLNRKQRSLIILSLMVLMMFASMVTAYAAGPGQKFGAWMQEQALGIFTAVLVFIAIFLLISRKLVTAIVVFVFAGISAWILLSPMEFATTIKDIVTSWF